MKRNPTYLLMLLCAVLAVAACHGSRHDDEDGEWPTATLSIYVYAPDHPMATRAVSTRGVDAIDAENHINRLQIWVFSSRDGKRLGYLEPHDEQLTSLNSDLHSEVFRMEVTDTAFISKPEPVDVYVLANVTSKNTGLAFDEASYRRSGEGSPTLEGALIGTDKFCPQFDVPTDGLPMSGYKRNVEVSGADRVLHVSMDHLTLVRAVSCVRFVFARSSSRSEHVDIQKIELNAGIMPQTEYLFLAKETDLYNSDTVYIKNDKLKLLSSPLEDIASCDSVEVYRRQPGQSLDAYYRKIDAGLALVPRDLSEAPRVYLRETDKPLAGTISYTVGADATPRTATFAMTEGEHFYRNRTWVVYAYYSAGHLDVSSVDVAPWTTLPPQSADVYNW